MKKLILLSFTLLLFLFSSSQKVGVVSKKPATDSAIERKIKNLLISMDNLFIAEKGKQTDQNKYYTAYESNTAFYGEKAVLKDREFEISFSLQISSPKISGADNAKAIFEKLKTLFINSGKFTFNNETVEGSRTWVFASEKPERFKVAKFSLVLEYYNNTGLESVGFLLNRKKL